jgi:hypothetical protein
MALVTPEEVIAWADGLVAEMASPPMEIIEVSLAARQPPDELARLLERVPGPADLGAAAHRSLGLLRACAVGETLGLGTIAEMLWVYSVEADLSEAEQFEASYFKYWYEDLAYNSTPESLIEAIGHFLSVHAIEPGDVI